MSQDLVISANNNTIDTELITQTDGYNVSDRYINISTDDVLNEITSYTGSEPIITGFNKVNVRKKEKLHKQRHAIICEMPNSEMIDGTKMNLVIYNSHDRTSSLKIYLGVYRMVCSNQMILGDNIAEPLSIRHTQENWRYSIQGLMDEYQKTQEKVQYTIQSMMDKYVSYGDIGTLCERVTNEIVDPQITGSILDPLEYNHAHRKEDTGKTLWNLTNRIQYNLLQGGVSRLVPKSDPDEPEKLFEVISNTHKISDVQKQIKVNQTFMNMAIELL